MNRWTMDDLKRIDDLDFAVCILTERRNGLNAYSPLATKLAEAVRTIQDIKCERDRYIAKVVEATRPAHMAIDDHPISTDGPCDPCEPTQPECGECEYSGDYDPAPADEVLGAEE